MGEPARFQLLDYIKGAWKNHSCAQIQPGIVDTLSGNHTIETLGWEPEFIPFQHQPSRSIKKRQPLTMGVVLKSEKNNENVMAEVVTPENQQLTIRILNPERPVRPGKAINLKRAVRVGKGKYRLEKLDFISPLKKSGTPKARLTPFYQLDLTAKDQEKLETFINQLVKTCNRNRMLPINVIPMPIDTIDGEQVFKREIHLPLESNLLLQIEKIMVPESVQITVRHR